MRRLAILAVALGVVLATSATSPAKEFVQFECGKDDASLGTIDQLSDFSDPSARDAVSAMGPLSCAGRLKALFGMGYKLTMATPRGIAVTGTGSDRREGGIVYLLEK